MKFPSRPVAKPSGQSGAMKSHVQPAQVVPPRDEHHRDEHAEKAAVERHPALPHREDLERMRKIVARLVKEQIPEAPAEDHADDRAE
jgi:hypothetical protein